MDEILIFGKGWIGSRLADSLKCPSTDARINTFEDAQREIDINKPKVIINCIGHFGKNVDDCEIDKTKTLTAHTFVPLLLAEVAMRNNIKLVHISSGCIYEYDYKTYNPISEDQTPDFFRLYYSRTKIYTEAALSSLMDAANILQLRLRMPLDYVPHRRNLLTKLLSFNKVIDLPNAVTYIPDLLGAVKHLIEKDATGIFNVVNYGGLRFRELLEEYRKYDQTYLYSIVDPAELNMVRTNLLLSTDKLEETGFPVRDIHEVIPECVEQYVKILKGL